VTTDPSTHHPDLIQAAGDLVALLEHENRMLAALDLAAAAALLPGKQRATNALVAARKHAGIPPQLSPEARHRVTALAERLRSLAAENRHLLERSIAAQGQVIAVIARAARSRPAMSACYGPTGAAAGSRLQEALAVVTRV
jgi:flagellar biosynthesis/type III secretory pathway chaperone